MVSVPFTEKDKQMDNTILAQAMSYWWVAAILIFLASYKLWLRLLGVVIIPENTLGLVNKKFVLLGSNKTLPDGQIIALKGEAGYQADTLPPGLHVGFWPWQYQIDQRPFFTVPQGSLGVIQAYDGKPLQNGAVLARHVECDAFQSARAFLEGGGQRGTQITVVTPGTYRLNTQMFKIDLHEATVILDGMVGIVTTLEGKSLDTSIGEIAGRKVADHMMYQNGEAFLAGNGSKGLQEEVILAGRYFFNPLFIRIECVAMTEVPMAHVGVIISYVGDPGEDRTGKSFTHGNLVDQGKKGVWEEPLDPGKYPINTRTHKMELVPTANIVLNWATGKTESHKLDSGLSTIRARTKDGFELSLDVSQIISISREMASRVIARFGDMKNLVSQALEPVIGNDFRNAAQNANALDFLRERTTRQEQAEERIKKTLVQFSVEATNTLIGDMNLPSDLMKTLTDRQIAIEQKDTYDVQREAEQGRIELSKATAQANTQASVVTAQRNVEIADFDAQASVKRADGQKTATIMTAEGEAARLKLVGDAEAAKIEAIGTAEGVAIQKKQADIGKENFTMIEVARAISASGQPLVPQIVAGGDDGGSNSLVNLLLANQLRAKQAPSTPATTEAAKAA